jgi:Domain of unknown function (DUF4177)
MSIYEYKFIKLKISIWTGKPKQNHQEIIQDHARQGWRLVQIVQPIHGHYEMEMIFERPV